MDQLYERIKSAIERRIALEPVLIPGELERVKLPLGLMDMRCYNFKGEGVRKVYFMRVKAKPSLDVFGTAIYPEFDRDSPIFVCDLSCTGKKVFTSINFISLFKDDAYRERHVEPMRQVYEKYRHFPHQEARDWMKPYLAPYSIYSMPEKTALDELRDCACDYLDLYLGLLVAAQKVDGKERQEEVRKAQESYTRDLATHDDSRKMLGRIIGTNRADRIFTEVLS